MRTIPGHPPGEERTFDLPVGDDVIRVTIRQPTERERRRLFRQLKSEATVEVDGEMYQSWLNEALGDFFVRVDGYARPTSTGPVPIENLADLRTYAETGVLEQIGQEIMIGGLTQAQKKTSSALSAGGSAEIQASHGTALAVASNNSAASADATGLRQTPPLSSEGSALL